MALDTMKVSGLGFVDWNYGSVLITRLRYRTQVFLVQGSYIRD